MKRYNLNTPDELFDEIESIAKEEHSTVVEVIRTFFKLGLFLQKIKNNPDEEIIIRNKVTGTEREIVLI